MKTLSSLYQLGWFSTARGKGSRGLLKATHDAIVSGELKAQIAFVFCSRGRGESEQTDQFLDMVGAYKIPLVTFSYRKFKSRLGITTPDKPGVLPPWRLDYDREVMERLKGFHPSLCVLAGYMLIVGPETCRKYDMLNLHPAAPWGPAGTWQEVIWELMETNARESGVMMHLATPELDRGPVAAYCTYSLRGEPLDRYWDELKKTPLDKIRQEQGEDYPLFKLIRELGYMRETPLIITTIKAFSEGKVKITPDKKVVDANGNPIKGYNLTSEIDKLITTSK